MRLIRVKREDGGFRSFSVRKVSVRGRRYRPRGRWLHGKTRVEKRLYQWDKARTLEQVIRFGLNHGGRPLPPHAMQCDCGYWRLPHRLCLAEVIPVRWLSDSARSPLTAPCCRCYRPRWWARPRAHLLTTPRRSARGHGPHIDANKCGSNHQCEWPVRMDGYLCSRGVKLTHHQHSEFGVIKGPEKQRDAL